MFRNFISIPGVEGMVRTGHVVLLGGETYSGSW
jgi:hypothetical protein